MTQIRLVPKGKAPIPFGVWLGVVVIVLAGFWAASQMMAKFGLILIVSSVLWGTFKGRGWRW